VIPALTNAAVVTDLSGDRDRHARRRVHGSRRPHDPACLTPPHAERNVRLVKVSIASSQ
jgi:hypothetical protein